jgi:hypothetical protein
MAHTLPLILFMAVLIVFAAGTAAVLHRAGMNHTGARSIGGLLAGFLLGPSILGSFNPQQYRTYVLGGADEHRALAQLVRKHGADLAVAEHARIDNKQFTKLRHEQIQELSAAQQTLTKAEFNHQGPIRIIIGGLVAAVLLCSGLFSLARTQGISHWPASISIGLWSGIVPAALGFMAAYWWWDCTIAIAAAFAAAFAVGPWILSPAEASIADEVEVGGAAMILNGGRIASCQGIVLAIGASALVLSAEMWTACTVLLALPFGWLILLANNRTAKVSGIYSHQIVWIFDRWALPALAALITVRVDVLRQFSIWPFVLAMVLSSDGRWLGAVLGAMLPGGRSLLRTMRLAIPSMAAGPNQLAIAGFASMCGLVSDSLVLAMIGGAAFVDLTANTRRRLALRIGQTEEELEQNF